MKYLQLRPFVIALLLGAGLSAAGAASADALSRADYAAHKRQIDADLRADQLRCRPRTGHDLRVCTAQALGRHKVAMAELDFNASGTDADALRLAAVKRDAEYAIARERCEALSRGPERDRCVGRAEALHEGPSGATRAAPLRKY